MCTCDPSVFLLTGQVTDGRKVPLDGAKVARAERPDIVLATTGSDGMFNIPGFCAQPQTMVVKKEMFTIFTGNTILVNSTKSKLNAVIERMGMFFS